MPTIRLEQVSKIYKNSRRGTSSTLQLDLTVRHGEFVFITGVRGSGKSTLMQIMAGELEPDHGKVWLGAANLWAMTEAERNDLRSCLGVITPADELRPMETVFKNLASEHRLEYLKNRLFDRPRIEKALALVGMPGCEDRLPKDMTKSERCRVLVAKAIWRSPAVVIADGLDEFADSDTVWDMLHLLGALNKMGTTVVFATGNSSYSTTMNKRVVNLLDGHITNGPWN